MSNKDLHDILYKSADAMDERTINIYVDGSECVMSERTKGVVYTATVYPANIPSGPSAANTYFSSITISFFIIERNLVLFYSSVICINRYNFYNALIFYECFYVFVMN